jgi:transcriptional regulator with XRE-family HTH domain
MSQKTTDMVKKQQSRVSLAQRLGARIASFRRERGFTQAVLAEKIGVDTVTVSRFERGATLPSLTTLEKLGDCLQVGVGELLSESSALADDQAAMLSELLSELNGEDRAFVVDLVKNACGYLSERQ